MMLEFIEQIWEHVSRWMTNTNIKKHLYGKNNSYYFNKKIEALFY